MARTTTARRIIWPSDRSVLVRAVFLYVGQGSSTLVLIRNGLGYDMWVVDINLDRCNGGIDVPRLVTDVAESKRIHAFLNTHPHDDHLCGVRELSDAVEIGMILQSGHVPSKKYGSRYPDLQDVIKKVKRNGGEERILSGSRAPVQSGDALYHVLAPAEYVTDEVNEAEADERRRRIHEQCAVVKFGCHSDWIMISGDADRAAFQEHITVYHKDRLPSFALAASHHGSRSFFMDCEGGEPYLDGLTGIDPECVFISAPTQEESRHDHPHDDAVQLYEDHVGEDNVHHLGEERYSYIVDIYEGGGHSGVSHDNGDLSAEYGLSDDEAAAAQECVGITGPFQRPQSQTGDLTPRKYG